MKLANKHYSSVHPSIHPAKEATLKSQFWRPFFFPFSRHISSKFFSVIQSVIESFCYRKKENRLKNENKTTGGLGKIWTGSKTKKAIIIQSKQSKQLTPGLVNLMKHARLLRINCPGKSISRIFPIWNL